MHTRVFTETSLLLVFIDDLVMMSLQAKLQVNMSHGERIAQCEHIKMHTTKALPVQIDGGIYMYVQLYNNYVIRAV